MPFLRLGCLRVLYMAIRWLAVFLFPFSLTYHPVLAFLDRFTYCPTVIHNPDVFLCFIIPWLSNPITRLIMSKSTHPMYNGTSSRRAIWLPANRAYPIETRLYRVVSMDISFVRTSRAIRSRDISGYLRWTLQKDHEIPAHFLQKRSSMGSFGTYNLFQKSHLLRQFSTSRTMSRNYGVSRMRQSIELLPLHISPRNTLMNWSLTKGYPGCNHCAQFAADQFCGYSEV